MLLGLMVIALCVLTPNFAMDNQTQELDGCISLNDTDMVDASVEEESLDEPLYYIYSDDFKKDEVAYFFNGHYQYKSQTCNLNNVSIIGQDSSKTVIEFDNLDINTNVVFLKDLTIIGANFKNQDNFTAENVIFKNGNGQLQGEFKHSYGGIILTDYNTVHVPKKVSLKDCTFINNSAEYGGAVYVNNGDLEIINCLFSNNYALQYGGAIAVEKANKVTVKQSRFNNDYSLQDAGGAIYIRDSILDADDLEIYNCSATFGAAITALNSIVSLNDIAFRDNCAKYEGGALFQMYGELLLNNSRLANNTAINGAAVFLDNLTFAAVTNNDFIKNIAFNRAGAIYSLSVMEEVMGNNTYVDNDNYSTSIVSLLFKDTNYTQFILPDTDVSVLPSYFNLADEGHLSPVKDQEDGGNCWAYSIIGALESSILKASNLTYDLSEGNVKNLMAKYSDYGWNRNTNRGGNDDMAIGYLVSWLGPVLESQDISSSMDVLSPLLNNFLHVQNVIYLKRNSYLDNNAIKQAIMKYGGVVTGMLYSSSYLKGSSYYYYGSSYTDHSVVIVGWDDDYSRYNFDRTPSGNGAFIVKNSWGDEWGDNGYFYVSYYDTRFAQIGEDEVTYVFPLDENIKYEKNYQYDVGKTDYLVTAKKTMWYENIFNATDNEYLAAISTYFHLITNWDCFIYVNNMLKTTLSGQSNPGYYTIPLGDLITLNPGDVFKVRFKISTNGFADVPICEAQDLNRLTFTPGISFVSYDGNKWFDLYDYDYSAFDRNYKSQVASIKAFTISNKLNSQISLNLVEKGVNSIRINALVSDAYGNPLNNGKVIFKVENQTIPVNVSGGLASLNYTFKNDGKANVFAQYYSDNYYSSNATYEMLLGASLDFNVTNIIYGEKISIKTFLIDEDGLKLTGKLNLTIANKIYIIDNGDYIVPDLFDANEYEAILTSLDDESLKVIKTFEVFKKPSNISINIVNMSGEALITVLVNDEVKNILVNVNNTNYTVNESGKVLVTNLHNGEYTVQVTYCGDENHLQNMSSAVFTIRIIQKDPILTVDVEDIYIGENALVKISINENATGSIIVEVDDLIYSLNESGNIVVSNLKIGEHIINAYYGGDTYFLKTNSSKIFNVKSYAPQVKADNMNVFYSDKSIFSAIIMGIDGKIARNSEVEFKINNKIIKTQTNNNGIASFKIDELPGTYEITITSLGVSAVKKLNMKQILTLKKVKIKKSAKKVVLTAILKKINGKYLKNKKITFKFNGKTYKTRTNKKGIAKVILNKNILKKLKTGKKVTYKAIYLKTSVKQSAKVKR